MTKEEARIHLINWIEFATNSEKHPFMDEPCSDEEILEAMRIGADALCQPQLPSNLDEAAEKSGLEFAPIFSGEALDLSGQVYETDDVDWPSRCGFIKGFKAGAEWMAKQGYTTEEMVYFERLCDENRIMVDFGWGEPERGGFQAGDRVIVQIRKKTE